jgi:hypothetical protein
LSASCGIWLGSDKMAVSTDSSCTIHNGSDHSDLINREWTVLYYIPIPKKSDYIEKGPIGILADIHDMDYFCTKLAPPPYNKPRRSCVSKINTPMVMVWFGNV